MFRPNRRWLAVVFAAALSAACGSSPSPSAPTSPGSTQLLAPTVFRVVAQKINEKNNELQLSWVGNATSYQLVIGSTPGSSNWLTTEVTGTTYTWVSPRTGGAYYARVASKSGDSISGYSDELSLFVLDIRNVIDAMYFHSGPMADTPSDATMNPMTSMWADGSRLNVLVSNEAGDTARINAQTFTGQYADLTGGAVTASFSMTSDTMHDTDYRGFPDFTIGVRVQSGYCKGALACVPVGSGPAPAGPNKSMVTLEQGTGLYLSATAHEMGHAYGMGHITIPAAGRPEFRFMMSPVNASEQMTDAEKLAIRLAYSAGLRAGMTRHDAELKDLVNPYPGASSR